MDELAIDATLVGQKVQIPARTDWGVGIVRKVASTSVAGVATHRVTIQFAHGTRLLIVPPARIALPQEEVQREKGWLDSISANSLDDRLRRVPDEILRVLGSTRQRLAAVYPLFRYTAEPKSIQTWARRQTGVGDPLSQWSRDELQIAFDAFVLERDAHLRGLAALLVKVEGRAALDEELAALDDDVRDGVMAALRRVV